MGRMKSALIRTAIHATGWALRRRSLPMPKRFIWNRICVPYLSWRDDEVICRTQGGLRFTVQPTDFVENRLCFFGIWEPRITALFRHVLQPGDAVVDVGANIGYFTSLASQLVGSSGRVIAVEASPTIRKRLQHNLDLNVAANVTVLPYAAWNESGTATLHIASGNRGGSSLCEMSDREDAETVQLSRLDDLIEPSLIPRIRLIKIDIEGAEYRALQGLSKILESNRDCVVVCEVDYLNIGRLGGHADDVFSLMKQYGYEAFSINNSYAVEDYTERENDSYTLTPINAIPDQRADVVFTTESTKSTLSLSSN